MRCAIYVRVSTNKEEQKTSLENQRGLFNKFLSEKNWDVCDYYVDVESGTTAKRMELQRLIKDAKEKKIDVILAKELSRLARNGRLSYEIRDTAMQYGIHIVTLDNAINTLEGNSSNFGLYAWLYEQESQRISDRIKRALSTKATRGEFKGSIPPLGYKVVDGKLYIRDDVTASVVRRIFNSYLSGKGFDKIAKELYEEGIPTPSEFAGRKSEGYAWQGSSVRKILENPHYMGDLVQGRETTKTVTIKGRHQVEPQEYITVHNAHEGIVSKTEFETVQQLIKNRRRKRPQAEQHLFTNTLYCADCGGGMHYKRNRKGYICGNYNKHGAKACKDHLIKEEALVSIVIKDIQLLSSRLNSELIMSGLKSKLENQKKDYEKQLRILESQIDKIKRKKTSALNMFVDGQISKVDYDEFVGSINSKVNELSNNKDLIAHSMRSQGNEATYAELKDYLSESLKLNQLTSSVLHRLIERIEIKEDGTPKIFYRFAEPNLFITDVSVHSSQKHG